MRFPDNDDTARRERHTDVDGLFLESCVIVYFTSAQNDWIIKSKKSSKQEIRKSYHKILTTTTCSIFIYVLQDMIFTRIKQDLYMS